MSLVKINRANWRKMGKSPEAVLNRCAQVNRRLMIAGVGRVEARGVSSDLRCNYEDDCEAVMRR
jgi:hypothetical protein